jgi:hypothetical protein
VGKEIANQRKRVWRDEWEYGRIRLYDHTSARLRTILNKERLRLYIERSTAKDLGASVTSWNRDIAQVSQILEEVNRLRREKGWNTHDDDDGDAQTASPELPDRTQESMGQRT